jgi:ATP-dependent DNA ligase
MTGPVIQNTDGIVGEGRALFDVVAARGMEGIVAKRLGSRYTPERRNDAWVKVKVPGYAPERWADWFDRGGPAKEPAHA